MYVLITYDVETITAQGQRRLRKVAKACVNHGQRVQNSVFECLLDPANFTKLRLQLLSLIDSEKDSIRFYLLGKNWEKRIETIGKETSFNVESELII